MWVKAPHSLDGNPRGQTYHGVSGHKPVEDHHKIKFSETGLEKPGVGEACQDGCPKDQKGPDRVGITLKQRPFCCKF
jgi:hypothetical protein